MSAHTTTDAERRQTMTKWAMHTIESAAKERDFAFGVLAVVNGAFREDTCAPPGSADESSYCEGGREALLRLEMSTPAGRIAHGDVITVQT